MTEGGQGAEAGSGAFSYRIDGVPISVVERPFIEWPKLTTLILTTFMATLVVAFCCTCGCCREKNKIEFEKSDSDIPPPFDDELAVEDIEQSPRKQFSFKKKASLNGSFNY